MKTSKKIFRCLVSSLILTALCVSLFSCSLPIKRQPFDEAVNTSTVLAGGMQVGDIHASGITLMSETVTETSATAEKTVTITATIEPTDAVNQGISWSIAWTNPSGTWASGKDIMSYVTLAESANNKVVTVSCLQAFGEQITLTAKSNDDPRIMATCTFEYVQKITSASINIGDINVNIGGITDIYYELADNVDGPGGTVSYDTVEGDVYTIAENFIYSFTLIGSDRSVMCFEDQPVSGHQFTYGEDITGKFWRFNYMDDASTWTTHGYGDFAHLTTAEIAEFFDDFIEGDDGDISKIGTIKLEIKGEYNTFTFTSELWIKGYTINTPVTGVTVDQKHYRCNDNDQFRQRLDQHLCPGGTDDLAVIFAVGLFETFIFILFGMIRFDHLDTEKHLPHPGCDIGDVLITFAVDLPDYPSQNINGDKEDRQTHQQHDYQHVIVIFPAGDDDRRQTSEHLQRSIGNIFHAVTYGIFQCLNIVIDPADELTGVHIAVKFQRLSGQFGKQLVAQIGNHPDTDPAGTVCVYVVGNIFQRPYQHEQNCIQCKQLPRHLPGSGYCAKRELPGPTDKDLRSPDGERQTELHRRLLSLFQYFCQLRIFCQHGIRFRNGFDFHLTARTGGSGDRNRSDQLRQHHQTDEKRAANQHSGDQTDSQTEPVRSDVTEQA